MNLDERDALLQRGIEHQDRAELDEAENLFERVLEISPRHLEATRRLKEINEERALQARHA